MPIARLGGLSRRLGGLAVSARTAVARGVLFATAQMFSVGQVVETDTAQAISYSPPGDPSDITTFTLTSSVGGSNLPFAIGHVFKQGDVPSGTPIGGDTSLQATIKNTWPDGSAKFALIAGRKTLTANVASAVTLRTNGTVTGGASLTITDFKATSITAAIEFGGVSVSWATTDWDSPHQTLTTGPEMSSWAYRKQIGSDTHLVAWLEVRYFLGGHVEVLPWIENGYLGVSSPTLKSGRAKFTLGGSLRYDSIDDANTPGARDITFTVDGSGVLLMPHHTRAVLVRAGTISYWLGTSPAITPAHNRAYMTASKIMPDYYPTTITESTLASYSATYNPGRVTYTNAGMGGTGESPDIGLFTFHVGAYMVSGDTRAYKAVLAQGLSISNYCIHYRDEATNRPMLFASHPLKSTTTGTDLPAYGGDTRVSTIYAGSHHPAAAYVPYLLTGWNWFLEETQFQANILYLNISESNRETPEYFFHSSADNSSPGMNDQSGVRRMAWQWRTIAMTASITPDADTTMRAQYINVLGYNASRFRSIQDIAGAGEGGAFAFGRNVLGVGGWGYENVPTHYGTWQDAFLTMSVGYAWDLDVITNTTQKADHLWFRDFKYKAVVGSLGRQGVTTEHGFTKGATYDGMTVGTGTGGSFVWYTDWGQVWTASYGSANTDTTANTLTGGNIDAGGDGFATSYWGNGLPALAYAVQHGATGAEDAYNRLIRATNWATKLPQLETYPGQGIKPRGYEPLPAGVPYSLPSVSNALAIETTSNGDTGYQSVRPSGMSAFNFVRTMVGSYGSGVFCENYSNAGAYIVAGSGGHGHPDTVDAYGFDFTTGAWFSLLNSNGAPRDDSGFNGTTATGSPWYEVVGYTEVPAPPHPYSHVVYVPPANGGGTKGSVMHAARAAVTTGASNTGVAHAFQLNTRTWSRRSTNGVSVDVEGRSIMDPVTSRVYVVVHTYHTKTALEYFDTSSVGAAQSVGSFTAPPDYGTDGCAPYPGLALDPVRRLLVRTLQRKLRAIDLNNINAGWQAITLTNATTLPDVPMGQTEPVWHPTREAFYWMPASGGSTLYKITPPATNPFSNAWVVTSQTIGGDTLHPHGGTGVNGDGVGAYKSLMYVPYVDRLAWIAGGHIDGTVYPVTLINPT